MIQICVVSTTNADLGHLVCLIYITYSNAHQVYDDGNFYPWYSVVVKNSFHAWREIFSLIFVACFSPKYESAKGRFIMIHAHTRIHISTKHNTLLNWHSANSLSSYSNRQSFLEFSCAMYNTTTYNSCNLLNKVDWLTWGRYCRKEVQVKLTFGRSSCWTIECLPE